MRRNKFNLSHYNMYTANMGELFPITCVPVLPGDTVEHQVSAVVRAAPLNTPVMHPVTIRVHSWLVPNRVVWPITENGGWEEFITGGPDGTNVGPIPTVLTNNEKKSMLSFLGTPPTQNARSVNGLSLRCANLIVNENYLDQDLAEKRSLDDNTLPRIAWEKDYFTTARPWAQRGPAVTLPIGGTAPVAVAAASGQPTVALQATPGTTTDNLNLDSSGSVVNVGGSDPTPLPMFADLASASQVDYNMFRAGFAIQRYQEARARYGARFVEYLRYLGVNPSDARLQRPEYLGGGTARLNFSEVLQTTPSATADTDGVGDLYGHGIAGVRTAPYRRFIEEHGYIITFMSIRPKAVYMNGIHREWRKTTKEDYFQKEFVNLGQQEVDRRELYLDQSVQEQPFGFQDRYDEYRTHCSRVAGDFRDTLNSWHLARELSDSVALNESFIECKPSSRIFQVTNRDSMWVMCNHKMVARRMLPKRSNPTIA